MGPSPYSLIAQEKYLLLAIVVGALAFALEAVYMDDTVRALVVSAVLVVTILGASMSVAHHAEVLARKVGDPYGTMILTLSAVLVEVIVLAMVILHTRADTLARDSIYSAVMLDINGTLGLAALIGGFKHGEQAYNDDSARTYTVMILSAMSIAMAVPEFVPARWWPVYGIFTVVVLVMLYGVFLRMQTGPHSYFFSYAYPEKKRRREIDPATQTSPLYSVAIMLIGVAVVGALAEPLSGALRRGLRDTHAPPALLALVVAVISAGPEILTALRAALANRMQSTVNIAMGASLSTVTLTVPVITVLALMFDLPLHMAMTPVQVVMTAITLIVAAINLNDGQTNAIEGMTHFALFLTFLMLTGLGL
ncbi:calcium:proton antiporter [Bordetella genomosp. 9]|uniref:Calcium:proton antiporter n=1 Tax=Bordetella genomosp. 9 TaxID=1416803 RepID=A0A1W6Z3T9_9BORD|nr:calcium:proton antiporter [Bordetella genomosp. 9]ARP87493.1 calcium:proton antiporter [Bordetella genomosp. 9]